MSRLIFHIDVNSAFLSWEAAKRVNMGEEDIRLIPSAIGGSREKRTGVILAKSIPAKKLGIRTGEPVSAALKKCPELFIAPPDFRLYMRNSRAFMDICREYAPVVEKYSIDECFLDMTGTQLLYPDPIAIAHEIKNKIRDTLGFTVNVGIGSNKLLAKMAGDFEKPDKVHTLFSHEIRDKLWPLPVTDLFSVGRATAEKLKMAQILTIGQLASCDKELLRTMLGNKAGEHLHNFANGIDHSPVLTEPEDAKGYSISTTLEEDITDSSAAFEIFLSLADSVAGRMRADGVKASCVGITIRDNDFKNRSHQRKLNRPTDITDEVYAISKELFAELWDERTPLRLLGISLTGLIKKDDEQSTLFTDERTERAKRMDMTIDALRSKYGSSVISRAAVMGNDGNIGRKYKAQLENKGKDDR